MSLAIDQLIGRAWRLYRSHWRHLVPVAAGVYVVVALATALLLQALGREGTVVSVALSVAGFYIVQGPATIAVLDVLDGRADLGVGETIARGLGAWRTLIPAALLAGAIVAIGFLLIIPGLILLTIWATVGSVAVLERRSGPLDVLGRSRALVRGHGVQVFVIIVAVVLLTALAGLVLASLLSALGASAGAVQLTSQLLSAVVVTPFSAICAALIYLGLREIRGEPRSEIGEQAGGGTPA